MSAARRPRRTPHERAARSGALAASRAGDRTPLSPASLLQLMRLASPSLPVGGFSYSEGLESAVDAALVVDEASAQRWLVDQLALALARSDMPLVARALAAWRRGDIAAAPGGERPRDHRHVAARDGERELIEEPALRARFVDDEAGVDGGLEAFRIAEAADGQARRGQAHQLQERRGRERRLRLASRQGASAAAQCAIL